jgi:eukaryotic-like serine/threonine-protein kinase
LHLSLLGRTGALRFRREGVILGRVAHPSIAKLLDAGVSDDGQPFLVLEFVQGTQIDKHCDARNFDVRQRIVLFLSVLPAVAHAHSHSIVHRDIKPSNIYVTRDGEIKLLDFGIAKLLLPDASDGAAITANGLRVLTPQYAAPEQLQGGDITTATDVYALGVLLFHLLVGGHPTAKESANSVEAMRAALEDPPLSLASILDALPSAAGQSVAANRSTPLPTLRRQLRGSLEAIVGRSLRKKASQRYQTVDAFADDLQRYLDDEPVVQFQSPEA